MTPDIATRNGGLSFVLVRARPGCEGLEPSDPFYLEWTYLYPTAAYDVSALMDEQ